MLQPGRYNRPAMKTTGFETLGRVKMIFRKFALATSVAALLAFSAGTASAETLLNRSIGSTIGSLDPQINFLAYEGLILDDLYEGLVVVNPDGKILPGAAESWEISDDGLTYTFRLRDGLQWSNGDKLTAQDFVNGIIRTINPETGSDKAYIFTSTIQIDGAAAFNDGSNKDPKSVGLSAPDERTFVMKLAAPAPWTLNIVNSFYCPPLHSPSFEKHGKDFIKPGNIVSNGAYVLAENVPQSHVTLTKNPNFWDAANVKIDKVSYRVSEDDKTAIKLWKAGVLDVTYDIPSDQIDALKAEYGDQVHVTASTETIYISFNVKKPPFDNLKLRQALSMALDRDVMINKVVKGGHIANYSYTIPISGYDAPKIAEATLGKDERVAKAKELYAEAGFGPDKPLSFSIVTSANDSMKKIAETAAVMWKQTLGADVKVDAQDRDAWLATFNEGNWDVFNDDLVGDFAGPETFLAYIDPRAGAGYNWESKEYEELWDKAAGITDQAERWKVLAQAEKLWLDSGIGTPIAAAPSRSLVAAKVKGWSDNPAGFHGTRFLSIAE